MGNSPEGDDLSARASILKTPSATTCSPVRNIVNKLIENVFTPDHVIQTECSSSLPHKSELEGKVKTEKPELKSPGHRELDRKDGAVKSAIEVVDLMSDSDEANASNKGTQAMLKPSPSSATKMDSFPPQKTQFSPEREMQEELKTGVDDCRDASKSPAGNQNTEACPKQFDLGAHPQEPSSNQMTPVATRGNSAFPPPESPSKNDIPGASLETSSKLVREESCKDFEAQSPFEPENEEPVFKSSFDHFQLGDVVDSKTANPKVVGLSPTPSPLRKDPHRQNLGNQSMVKHESKPSSSPSGKDSNHPPNSKSAIIVLQDSIPARGIAKKGGSDAETKQNMALVDMRANDKHILFQATNTVLQTGVSHLEKKLVSNIQDHSRKFSVDGNTSQNKPPGDTNQNPTSAISAPFYNKERAEEQRKMSVDPNRRMAYSMQHKRGSEDTPGAGEVGAKSKVTADSTPVKAHEDIGTGNKSLVIGANNRNGKFISPNETRRDSASPDQTDRRRNGSDKKKSGSRTEAVRNKELEGRRASENKEHATIERMKSPNETRAAKSNLEPEANALISKKRHTDVLPGDLDISDIVKNREEPPMKRHKSIEMRTTPPRKAKKRERGASSSPKHQKKPYSKELSSLKSLKGTTFSGHSELSTLFSHKVIATIGGRKYTGWVLDSVNTKMSTEELKFRNEEERKKRANGGMEPGVQTPPKNSEKDIAVDLIPETRSPETCELKRDLFLTANGRPESALAGSVIQRSVIVIGAGIAGIAAARVLSDRGFKVTILEGRGRIGGRIATDWSSGFPVDLGAAYIHGTYGNPLSEVAQAADLPTFVPKDVDTLLYADGKKVSRDLDELAENVWKALLQRAAIVAKMEIMKQKDIDISLGKLLNRLKINVKGGCSKELDRLLGWHASNLEMACASELNQLSAKHYDMDDRAGFSGSHKLVRDGFSSIVYTLARHLDIRCGSRVVCIQRDVSIKKQADSGQAQARESGRRRSEQSLVNSPANMEASDESEPTKQTAGVRVITEDGYEHLAESCIITTPLGVLQSEDIAFFPPLPQKKRVAISNVGFGLVNKVVLHFETPFWSVISDSDLKDQNHSVKSGKTVGRVDRTNIAESDFQQHEGPDQLGRVAVKQGVFSFFLSLWRCVGAPILVAVVTGEFAEFIERCSDKEVVDMALKALWDMFPRNPPSRLVSHVVTRWKADRFSRGSYSFAKVGTSPQDYIEISKPVGKLYFAGEATHRDHPATAHGAYMSGIREAARIIARSGLDESLRKQYARELFLMQNPLSSLENNNINGDMMNSIPSKQTSGNANGSVSQKRSNSRTPRKRKKGKRVE